MTNKRSSENEIQHEVWNASLLHKLEHLRIRCSSDLKGCRETVVNSLKKYGFALVCGVGEGENTDAIKFSLQSLASQLGVMVPQSPLNQMIEDVRDFSDIDNRDDRGYRSRGELTPHSDPPTLILLHCLQSAKSGGETYVVNVRAIHGHIEKENPELLKELYSGFPHWLVEGSKGGPGPAPQNRPIFMKRNGAVSCVHYRPFVEQAADALEKPLTPSQIDALNLFDYYAKSEELALRFCLLPGDTLILHNRTVFHARTDYEDWPEQERRRHLLRIWIDAPELLPVSTEHELGDIFSN